MVRADQPHTTNRKQDKMRLRKPVREWVEGIDDISLRCRDLHHAWMYSTIARDGAGYERRLLCTGCGAIKVQSLSPRGMLTRTKYEYPENYLRPKGFGRISKQENALIRLQSILSAVEEQS